MEMTKQDIESVIDRCESAIGYHRFLERMAIENHRPAIAAIAKRARNKVARELAVLDQKYEESEC